MPSPPCCVAPPTIAILLPQHAALQRSTHMNYKYIEKKNWQGKQEQELGGRKRLERLVQNELPVEARDLGEDVGPQRDFFPSVRRAQSKTRRLEAEQEGYNVFCC